MANKFRNPGLRQMASELRGNGQRYSDEIPHFKGGGFFKKVLKVISPITDIARNPKKALPMAGAVIGNMIAPGLGGSMVGGAIGGAASSKKHPFEHALAGAGMGAIGSLTFGGGE